MAIGIGIGLPFGKKATPNPDAQAPVNTSPPVISPEGNQVIGTVFTSGNGSWFATRPLTFEYRWTRNGTPISGATSQTYTSVSADEGQTLRCEVRGVNAFGTSAYVASSNSSTGVSLPVNTVAPVISGSTTLGSVLTTTDGTWTGTAPITFSYQWKRGGVSIGGATASTYTLVAADSSANIICEVTGTNAAGSVAANSNTITAANFNPVNTIAPTLSPSGTQSTGTVITLGNGTWSGATPITFEYRWTRDNIVISGQTSNTYTIVAGDDGKVIKGEVRGINSVSTSAYVTTSNQVDATATPAFQGLLDLYPNAAAAYSLRKLRAAYTGSAVRIRRSSDNAESDIGFLNNEFDSAAAQTFCGAGNGFITTWYDQENSFNLTNSTASTQPQIVASGLVIKENTKACVSIDNVDDMIKSGVNFGSNTSIFSVFKNYDNIGVIYTGTNEGGDFIYAYRNNTGGISSGATVAATYRNGTIQVMANQLDVLNCIDTGNLINFSSFLTLVDTARYSDLQIGAGVLGSTSINWSEIIIYSSDKLTDRVGIENNQSTYYNI